MIGLSQQHKYYYHTEYTDLRKGFDGLSGVIRNHLHSNPCDGNVYIFINKKRDKMKMLVWESTGFMMYYKRLEVGTFELPSAVCSLGKMKLNWETLVLMIQGIKLQKVSHRKRYKLM